MFEIRRRFYGPAERVFDSRDGLHVEDDNDDMR
jgi:hypothetical protein